MPISEPHILSQLLICIMYILKNSWVGHLFQFLTLHFEVNVDFVEFSLFFWWVEQALAFLHEIDSQFQIEVLLLQTCDLLFTLAHCELGLVSGPVAVQGVTASINLGNQENKAKGQLACSTFKILGNILACDEKISSDSWAIEFEAGGVGPPWDRSG